YPVLVPGGGKLPLINRTAQVQGWTERTVPGGTMRMYGVNVYVVPHALGATSLAPGNPSNGKISGTARLQPNSVVGHQNTATNARGSAEFRIEGIPIPAGSYPF